MMIMTIETMPLCKIACIRHFGPYGEDNRQTMESLKAWARANGLLDDESVIFGIAQDNPQVTPPEKCRYDACLVVSEGFCPNDERVNVGTLMGGKYAVFTIDHTSHAVQKAWSEIFPELLRQGCTIDTSKPIIERYAVKMVNDHKCEICVPIALPSQLPLR